MVKSSITRH
ncbi:unnamed protein product [Candida parapsilosis]